jgi:hypothetical protein
LLTTVLGASNTRTTYLVNEPHLMGTWCTYDLVGKVYIQRSRKPDSGGQGLRQHAKRTHATHKVAKLNGGLCISDHVISMHACCQTAADKLAMHRTHDGNLQLLQLKEPVKSSLASECRGSEGNALRMLLKWVAADREVWTSALKHHSTDGPQVMSNARSCGCYVCGQICGNGIESIWIMELNHPNAPLRVNGDVHHSHSRLSWSRGTERAHGYQCTLQCLGRQ